MTRDELVAWLHETGDIPFALGVALEDIVMAEAFADAVEAALIFTPKFKRPVARAAFAKSLGGTDEL